MTIDRLLQQLDNNPNDITFSVVMQVIDDHYEFTETAFSNGEQKNAAGENSGSCKILSFAILHNLSKEKTLPLFGQYYRDVLNSPEASDHQNIRQFMLHGFAGVTLSGNALTEKR